MRHCFVDALSPMNLRESSEASASFTRVFVSVGDQFFLLRLVNGDSEIIDSPVIDQYKKTV